MTNIPSTLHQFDSEAKFQTLLETASVAIVIVNQFGQIELINRKAEELFAYQREELIGQTLEVLLPERFRTIHVLHRQEYLSQPGVRTMGQEMQLAGRRKDGSEFPVEIGLSYLKTAEGLLTVSFITDVSERKRSQDALERYARRLESMREIERAILAARSTQEIARVALQHLQNLVPCDRSCVLLFNFESNQTVMLASLVRNQSGACCSIQKPNTFLYLTKLKQNEHHLEINDNASQEQTCGMGADVVAYLDMPLVASNHLIGILRLAAHTPDAFNAEEVNIARQVANHLAIALQQAQLQEKLQHYAASLETRVRERTQEIERRRQVAEGMREILTVLNSNRPLDEILDYLVALASGLIGSDATAVFELQEHKGPLKIVATQGLEQAYVTNVQIPLGLGIVGKVVQERRPMAISDISSMLQQELSPPIAHILHQLAQSYRSLLAVPLIVKDDVYGCIVLYYTNWRLFSSEEVGLAVAFGDQAALAIENARLRAQVQQSAVIAERNRLARDLHDAVTQTLFSASLIADVLPRLWERQPEEGQQRLQELRDLTRGALAEMRTLLFELRPNVLVKTDLRDLLRQLAEATTGRCRVPVSLTVEGRSFPLPPDVQVAFYRIAQEALNNVAKHSAAKQASVTLRFLATQQEKRVILSVYDNGKGFILEDVAPQRLGLNIMQERAQAIGATLMIDSEAAYGTEIMVDWLHTEGFEKGA